MMKSTKELSRYSLYEPLICRICGDQARGNNFQVITCMSCKAFFRRNAIQPRGTLRCPNNNNCIITQRTRTRCPACRLEKCFALGMNPQLIRQFHYRQIISTNIQQSINSIQNDSSTLTTSFDQWRMLSNIIHANNQINPIDQIKYAFENQSSLPPKLRFKSIDAYRTLIKYDLARIGIIHGFFLANQIRENSIKIKIHNQLFDKMLNNVEHLLIDRK